MKSATGTLADRIRIEDGRKSANLNVTVWMITSRKNGFMMATVVVVIVPVMIAYPFFQRYFIRGLTVGSVKG